MVMGEPDARKGNPSIMVITNDDKRPGLRRRNTSTFICLSSWKRSRVAHWSRKIQGPRIDKDHSSRKEKLISRQTSYRGRFLSRIVEPLAWRVSD
jgi:hypothetical protein